MAGRSLMELPREVLRLIAGKIDQRDFLAVCLTCKGLRLAIMEAREREGKKIITTLDYTVLVQWQRESTGTAPHRDAPPLDRSP